MPSLYVYFTLCYVRSNENHILNNSNFKIRNRNNLRVQTLDYARSQKNNTYLSTKSCTIHCLVKEYKEPVFKRRVKIILIMTL